VTHRSVLIVDPSASWVKKGCGLLRRNGYEAVGFSNGDRAFHYLESHSVDIVVADLSSLKLALLRRAASAPKYARMLLLVRSSDPLSVAECFRLGASDCVRRSLDDDEFLAAINKVFPAPTLKATAGARA
jgi:DNA-binding NarL/FixJ family response regulator